MSAALLATRLLLAAVFGVAGVAKLLDRAGSRSALVDFGAPVQLAVSEFSETERLPFSMRWHRGAERGRSWACRA